MIIINADDFGLSRGINNGIIKSINNGIVNGISIIPNGYAFNNGIKKISLKKIKKISIHLNLVEFKPISQIKKVNKIIDKNNELSLRPLKLVIINFFYSKVKKKIISNQIKIEMENQIKKVIKNVKNKKTIIGVDSHYHIHMIPFIFEILLSLTKKYKIKYIRIPVENNILKQFNFKHSFEFLINLPKVISINIFSLYSKKKYFNKFKIKSNSAFYGSLFAGNFTLNKIIKVLKLSKKNNVGITEIISHPGDVILNEKRSWKNKNLVNNYFSKKRVLEKQTLSNQILKNILNN